MTDKEHAEAVAKLRLYIKDYRNRAAAWRLIAAEFAAAGEKALEHSRDADEAADAIMDALDLYK